MTVLNSLYLFTMYHPPTPDPANMILLGINFIYDNASLKT